VWIINRKLFLVFEKVTSKDGRLGVLDDLEKRKIPCRYRELNPA
jgi:hypothetical protein